MNRGCSSLRSETPPLRSGVKGSVTVIDVESLKRQIKQLNPDQLKEVIDFALYEKDVKTRPSTYDRNEEMLYSVLAEELKSKLSSALVPFHVFKKGSSYARFREVLKHVDEFLRSTGIPRFTTPERKKMYSIVIRLVVERASELDVPLGVKLVLNQSDYIPGLFDRAFPGYLRSGLVRMLL